MVDSKKPIGRDAGGFDALTPAIKSLLNQYPGLYEGEEVKFEELGKDSGIIFSANSGALVYAETRDITDTVRQECRFPFYIVYRENSIRERDKLRAQDFLDKFGKWLCREPVEINGALTPFPGYPRLSGGRKITNITRENSYGQDPREDGVQDWVLPVTIEYTNKFTRW